MPFSILYKYYVMSCLKLLPYIYGISKDKFFKFHEVSQSQPHHTKLPRLLYYWDVDVLYGTYVVLPDM